MREEAHVDTIINMRMFSCLQYKKLRDYGEVKQKKADNKGGKG